MQRPLALLVLLLLGSTAPFDRSVVEGTELRRSFRFDYALELERLEMFVDGEEVPGVSADELEIVLESERLVVVEDEYGPSDGARPRRLVRYFHELQGETVRTVDGPGGSGEQRRSSSSELEGLSVVFALDEERDEYVVSFDDEGADEVLLEGLSEDMDLRAWLPEVGAELEPGDTHELPAEAFLAIARPGGVLLFAADDGDLQRGASRQLAENLEGEIAATYRGRRDEGAPGDGPGGDDALVLDVLELTIEVTSFASQRVPTDSEAEVNVRVDYHYSLRGELLWDSASGHLHGLELEGEVSFVERNTVALESSEREQVMHYAGELEVRVEIE